MAARRLSLAGLIATLAGLSVGVAVAAQALTQAEADRMAEKVTAILKHGELPRTTKAAARETRFTEREANAFFQHYGAQFMPTGVQGAQVTIGERGRVSARATVSLDEVRKARERSWLDPLAYVTGSLEVTAAGSVVGANGTGVFQFESATLAGVSVSKALLQELVRFYTTSPEMPGGFDLDQPFALPAGIREVRSANGTAIVVQ